MKGDKERQEVSLIGRLLSMEVLILLMGIASLVTGIINSRPANIVAGILLLLSLFLLNTLGRRWLHH
ncbi:hypothetical protein [Geomesophilobacter sediminis]|uniref:Uncharacterized protein n=1 Tax=Geomesophilobacter sediminis TaxID=2798584 RepID=A0A8J7JD27_9BACT|nr:hypothetical protein [Geomesophilobacter sediminis]MBJ6723294.1 hypothetical protein [Geomesophilobacter sediminis]